MRRTLVTATVGICAAAILAACGGSSDEAFDLGGPEPILADGSPVTASDYIGLTFPLLVARSFDRSPDGFAEAVVGSIEFVDADTLVIDLPTRAPFTLNRVSGNTFTDSTGVQVTFDDFGAFKHFYTTAGPGRIDVTGGVGFQTPDDLLPSTATYAAPSASQLYITIDGEEAPVWLNGNGTVNLTADFRNGRITGDIFNAANVVDADFDGNADDEVYTRMILDGEILSGGFRGTVEGEGSVRIDLAGPPVDLNLRLGGAEAKGTFYGNAGEVVSGVYDGDLSVDLPGQPGRSGSVAGFFYATD